MFRVLTSRMLANRTRMSYFSQDSRKNISEIPQEFLSHIFKTHAITGNEQNPWNTINIVPLNTPAILRNTPYENAPTIALDLIDNKNPKGLFGIQLLDSLQYVHAKHLNIAFSYDDLSENKVNVLTAFILNFLKIHPGITHITQLKLKDGSLPSRWREIQESLRWNQRLQAAIFIEKNFSSIELKNQYDDYYYAHSSNKISWSSEKEVEHFVLNIGYDMLIASLLDINNIFKAQFEEVDFVDSDSVSTNIVKLQRVIQEYATALARAMPGITAEQAESAVNRALNSFRGGSDFESPGKDSSRTKIILQFFRQIPKTTTEVSPLKTFSL